MNPGPAADPRSPIVPATTADAGEIQRLLEASGLPTGDLNARLLPHFLVCRQGGELIAVVGLEPAGDTALLRSLAVTASLGGGVGRQMVAAAEASARRRGIATLYLLTTTAPQYFSRLGYRHVPRSSAPAGIRDTPQFSSLCPSSSSFMAKVLAADSRAFQR